MEKKKLYELSIKAMRITFVQFVLAVSFMSMSYAHEATFQTDFIQKIYLQAQDESFSKVLKQIGKQTKIRFVSSKTSAIEVFPRQGIEPVKAISAFIVTGVVTDDRNQPLVGASVVLKSTQKGALTDVDGKYVLELSDADKNGTLVISFVGYETQTIPINGRTNIAIQLSEGKALSEVVVVGYGVQKKANLTGAVDQVSGEVFDNRPLSNINQGLQGVLPNLNIKMGDGKPNQAPSFNIRGTTSIGQGGNALVLIDNVEGDPSLLNPSDVASITLLKDAASASIYGARGVFGVVLITTKNPTAGKTNITYSTNYSIKDAIAVPNLVTDGYTWASMFAESFVNFQGSFPQNVNKTMKFSQAYLNEFKRRTEAGIAPSVEIDPVTGEYVYYGSEDYYGQLYKSNTNSKEHNISISGSSDKASYLLSGRYFGQDGLFRYNSDDYQIFNFSGKGSIQLYKWLKVTNMTQYSDMKYHNPLNVGEGGGIWRNIADEGHAMSPMLNPDGSISFSAAYSIGDFYYGKNGIDNNKKVFRNTSGFSTEFFENKFRIKGDFTVQNTDNNDRTKAVQVPYSIKPGVVSYVGTTTNSINDVYRETLYMTTNLYAEYENTFKKNHYLKFMVGYNYEQSNFKRLSAQRNGLIFENANDINLALGQVITTSGGWEVWKIQGGFSRINYSFKDRYLLEINGRYDGSSKFPTNQRFAFFPSYSVGWRVSNEPFWKVPDRIISGLKLRGSYGSLGNGNIASYAYLEQFGISQSGLILNGQKPQFTRNPTVLPEGLTWETATTSNVGIDLSMLSNKLSFIADAYIRRTTDMFTVGLTLPAVFGATAPKGNYADLETKGWEAMLSYRDKVNIGTSPLNFDIRLTMADNTSVIKKYNNPEKQLSDYYEGQVLGEIWGYTTAGYFTSADDVKNSATQNLFRSANSGQWFPGDIKFVDTNGDGAITPGTSRISNPGDRSIIGNSNARYTYGIMLGADWRNFFFSGFLQGVGKQDWYPSREASLFWGQYNRPYSDIPKSQLGNIWKENNVDAYWPRYVSRIASNANGTLSAPQTKYLQNVRYIRLKNIQLGYNLPKNMISKIGVSAVKVYVSAENIWTASPFFKVSKDFDVENAVASDQVFSPGGNSGDGYNYPLLKSVTFGLSVSF